MSLVELAHLVEGGTYIAGRTGYFSAFSSEWKRCRSQILKYESCMDFCVVDSDSWRAMNAGDWERSLELIPNDRKHDFPLYERFRQDGVDIVRVRPIKSPLSTYVKWEIQNYFINKDQGERIFVTNYIAVKEYADRYANHDFIVFDARMAVVHDIDENGVVIGGWILTNLDAILQLMSAFTFIKSQGHPFDRLFQREVGHA